MLILSKGEIAAQPKYNPVNKTNTKAADTVMMNDK